MLAHCFPPRCGKGITNPGHLSKILFQEKLLLGKEAELEFLTFCVIQSPLGGLGHSLQIQYWSQRAGANCVALGQMRENTKDFRVVLGACDGPRPDSPGWIHNTCTALLGTSSGTHSSRGTSCPKPMRNLLTLGQFQLKGIRRLRVCCQLRCAGDCTIIPPLISSHPSYLCQ